MTHAQAVALALIPAAYLAGSIPFGLLVGLSKGVDPRKAGSGNIGATNVGRLLGGKYFALVFILDMLKGLLPTAAAGAVFGFAADDAISNGIWLTVGFAAIVGHMYSLFIGFKGGKGVATSCGVILGVFPYYTLAGAVAMLVFLIAFRLTRYVSVGSIVAAVMFTVAYVVLGIAGQWDVLGKQLPLLFFAVLVSGMIVYKHRTNIARLRAGTEHRFTGKGKGPQPPVATAG